MVTMCGTAWRARSTVTDLPKVILALLCSILKRFIVSDAGGEFLYVRRNVVKHPVNPRSSGSIRIIRNQRETLAPLRCILPTQGNRHVGAIAGVFLRNRCVLFEC